MSRSTATTLWTKRHKTGHPDRHAASHKAEEYFNVENLADAEQTSTLPHHINQAIKAYGVMQRDIDYVVKDGEVIIVDEFTGRLMLGRRYNEGLHQAIEAKEGVKIAAESQDAGHHHVPELLPYVQEALRYDRHGHRPRPPSSPRSTA